MSNDRTEQLRKVRDDVVSLIASPLCQERLKSGTHPVVGEGHHWARVVMIGEAPGRHEAASGRPFVGASGKMLDFLLASISLSRDDIYITNIVKDRPPHNRDPLPEEIELYSPFLERQLCIIEPEVIVPLGRYAMQYILRSYGLQDQIRPISEIHGVALRAAASYGEVTILPLYHPAVAIYNASTKQVLLDDIAVLKQFNCHPKLMNTDSLKHGV